MTSTPRRRPTAADLEAAMRRHPAGRAATAPLTPSPLPVRAARAALDFVGGWVSVALVVGIVAGYVLATSTAAHPAPAPAPLTLTLADAHGWTPDAILDTTQVEAADDDTWPLGASFALPVVETAWGIADVATEWAWGYWMLTDGNGQPTPDITTPDGVTHTHCYIVVGDTSAYYCADGFTDES